MYKMELVKIFKRKSTWIILGILLLGIAAFCGIESGFAPGIKADFGQLAGYKRFLDLSGMLIVFAGLGEIIILASFFCEDKQNKMDVLLKTAKKGKLHDFVSRWGVVFTFVLCLNLLMVAATYMICYTTYGFSGESLPLREMFISDPLLAEKSVSMLIKLYLLNVVNASVLLSALIVCISTVSEKPVHSLIVIASVAFLPALLEGIFQTGTMNAGYTFVTSQPIMLVTSRCVEQSYRVYGWHIFLVYAISVMASYIGGKQWCSRFKK